MTEELPHLISDLALILVLAGVVTILFKKLKQPLVLGYIVAGFLASPYMPYTPSLTDTESIHVWSQLGIIFLMFSLGLEFSFKKILKNGLSPILTTALIMCGMMATGCAVGKLMGFSSIDCIYLGGMLSVSSTTIIYKAYADMGLSNKQFAGNVIAVLVLEDIFAIVLMAFLASFTGGGGASGPLDILMIFVRLLFFLLLWFTVGIWLIPTFLRRYARYINKETLLIVSVGLCFLMVVIAHKIGYGAELGAFVMGSILAETLEAERIDSAIDSVKDLFGAVFFVSVGMMVEPAQVVSHWGVILVLVLTILVGNIIFGFIAFLAFGSSLKDAVQSSFSMVQIGEFSFIIATMGVESGYVDGFLYPVIVAVSIITTFLTPYFISFATKLKFTSKGKKTKKTGRDETSEPMSIGKAWRVFLVNCVSYTLIYGILCFAVIKLLFVSLLLVCRGLFTHWPGNCVCGLITLFLLALFLRPIVVSNNNNPESQYICRQGKVHFAIFSLIYLFRFCIAVAVVYYVFDFLSPFWWQLHVVLSVAVVILIIKSKHIKRLSKRMETAFLFNLSRREEVLPKENEEVAYARRLQSRDLHVTQLRLPARSQWGGKTLSELQIGAEGRVIVT
ncbi:MAG: cation:proton antiporter, partial [Prevotellaceae bacterium]|nr:cation:proton antiporter [Prevotellaceae bacterium]